jgi:hypothetical protein
MAPVNFTIAKPIDIVAIKNMIFPLDLAKPLDSPAKEKKTKLLLR